MSGSERAPLPADVPAVKAMGVAAWQARFMWPVTDAEFWSIADAAHAVFDKQLAALETADPPAADCLLADTTFLNQIVQALHAELAAERAEKLNRPLAFSAAAPFAAVRDPARSAAALSRMAEGPPPARRLAARLAKRVVLNRPGGLPAQLAGIAGRGNAWMIGSQSALSRAYADQGGLVLDAPSIAGLVGSIGIPRGVGLRSSLRAAVAAITEEIAAAVPEVERFDWTATRAAWQGRLELLEAGQRRVAGRRDRPVAVLLGESSKPWPKLVGLAMKRIGARLVGMNHGNYVGQMSNPGLAWHTHAPCDEVVCYSPADAELLALDYAATSIGARRPVRFRPLAGSSILSGVADRLAGQAPRRGPVRTVMIIGYPMTPQRYAWSAGDYFAFQLDAELRLARLLREAGYRVIYKMHPDRQAEATGIFESEVDEIIVTRFEEVWARADAFVFGNIMTTVFNVAALTDRPIIALEVDGYRWMPQVRVSCARRVQFVRAAFDPANRLQFDPAAILAALAEPAAAVDQDYATRYLLRSAPPRAAGGLTTRCT